MVKSFPDQKEYLKKYLSGHKEKKLKKKSVNASKGVKLIDDDESMKPVDLDDDDIFLHGEEAPQIVLGDGVDSSALQDGFKKWKSISAVQIKVQEKTKFLNNFSVLNSPSTSNFNEERKIGDLIQRKSNEKDTISQQKKYKNEKLDHSSKNKSNYSNDLSPPRNRYKYPSPITTKLRNNSNDYSPERKNFNKRDRSEDLSPPKRKKNSSSSDLSPERIKTGGKSKLKDSFPCKYADTTFMSQISPGSTRISTRSALSQRKRTSRWDNVKTADERQNSPEMQKTRSSSSDQSPQIKTDFKIRKKLELPALEQKTSTNTDRSTSRSSSRNLSKRKTDLEKRSKSKDLKSNSRKRDNSNDLSLNRKRSPSSDLSPQRKQCQKNSSPIKRKETYNSPKTNKSNTRSRSRTRHSNENRNVNLSTKQNSPDLSPPRFSEKNRKKDISNENQITKMADGKTSGLRNAKDLQEDLKDFRAKELEMLKETSIQAGQFAEPVIRSHARYKPESLENQIKNKKKEEENEKRQEVYNRWGKGLKQIEDHKAKVVDQEYESSKPLARYADDQDLDKMLKQVEREGDPMLNYLRSKKEKDRVNKKQPEKPIYKGSYPENRYGIRPGYRWDGVDRSNGYEKKYFEKQNSKRALEEEAYRYSTEDM